MSDAIQIVNQWHEAVNSGDTERLADLVSEDVEIGGPRGTDLGLVALVGWVERTGIRLEPTVWYQRGETIVVCQLATWPGEGGAPGDPQPAASAFVVHDDRILSIVRYADQIAAFGATGLTATDRVQD
jgi:ketosteroid isomerase-like protein